QRLDRVRSVVLHALEDDQAIARRADLRLQRAEVRPHAHGFDLVLYEALDRLLQRLLHFTDAHPSQAGLHQGPLNKGLREEVALAATATSVRALVSCGRQ